MFPLRGRLGLCLPLLLLQSISPAAHALDDATAIVTWGRKVPLHAGVLATATSLAVNSATGDVYTVEPWRIQRWSADGKFVETWSCLCQAADVDEVTGDVYATRGTDNKILRFSASGELLSEWGGFGSGPGQFNRPFGISVDTTTGDVYVMDVGNNRVQVLDTSGAFVRQFSNAGMITGPGVPAGLDFDEADRSVWVTNPLRALVQKFDEFGNLQAQAGTGLDGPGLGQLRWPRSVGLDAQGNAYVTDTDNERIQYFAPDGTPLGTFQGPNDKTQGAFHPRDIAINRSNGKRYVLAAYASRIDRFDSQNGYELSWGPHQKSGPVFLFPRGIAASPITGDLYVFDTGNFRVKRATAGGAFLEEWGESLRIDVSQPGLFGSFISSAITTDAQGDVWTGLVTLHYKEDPPKQFVQKFGPSGNHLLSLFRSNPPVDSRGQYNERVRHLETHPTTGHVWITDAYIRRVQEFATDGSLLTDLSDVGTPAGIALYRDSVYVADAAGHLIHKFDAQREHTQWGGLGSGDGQFVLLDSSGITVDADGNVYVADSLNHRIQKFDSEGTFLGKFGGRGTGLGEFNRPIDLTFSPDFSVLHVVEQASHRIQSLCMPGVPLATCRSQLDQDRDSLLDAEDNCPFRANLDQSDQDSDGVGDVCDNCLTVANPTQADAESGTDDDSSRPGIQHYGNRCDADLDGNGIVNTRDFFGGFRRCFGQTPSTTPDCAASDFNGDDRVNTLDFFGYFLPKFQRAPGPGISEP